ncbi:MAG: (2Fe-2S)-binding protein [Rhodospirillales bacterium]|nr:(2Fe-2S)-binding protein [Rhodospirillales bacterium]
MDHKVSHNIVDESVNLPPDPAEDFDWSPATEEIAGGLIDLPIQSWRTEGTTRRAFLRGVVCSGVAVSASAYIFGGGGNQAQAATKAATRGVERMITLNINGKQRRVDVAPNETLSHTIRYKLGMTGTKIGCNKAECGACTVISDGQTIYSCSTLTHRVRGKKITTIEGISGPDGKLHPVQQAFVDEMGPQCGFCTPGQVLSAVALLDKNPKPTADEARRALSGNLCRCGAYDHYLKGVMRASGRA